MKNAIIITGGAGYIGFEAVKKLSKFCHCIIIDKKKCFLQPNCTFIKSDFSNEKKLKMLLSKHRVILLIHLAAFTNVSESEKKPKKYINNNYLKTIKILKFCKNNKIKNVIFASSSAVYGNIKVGSKVSEKSKLNPISTYAITKKKVEDFLKREKYFNYCILRFFNVVGFNQTITKSSLLKSSTLFSNILKYFIFKKKFEVYGNSFNTKDGYAIRDFISIVDIGKIIKIASMRLINKNNKGKIREIFNCGSGYPLSNSEIINLFEKVYKKKIMVKYKKKRDVEIEYMLSNNNKLKKTFEFKRFIKISKILNSYKELK